MGLFTKDIETLDDLFLHTLHDIYYAEQQITKALPKMIEKATNSQLKQGFETHLRETEVEVLAQPAGLDLVLEVAVGGGDDAGVDLDRLGRADRSDLALLEHAQQLDLKAHRHVADLVEEQRAVAAELEDALAVGLGVGEGAAHVAE